MKFDFKKPDFLFCEIAKKDGTQNDDRIWIYHTNSLSLIEFINVDDFINSNSLNDFQFNAKQDRFEYEDENWFGVYVQNNCEATGYNQDKVLNAAWLYLVDYFKWEDTPDKN